MTGLAGLGAWVAALRAAPAEARPGTVGAGVGDGSLVRWLREAGPAAAEGWLIAHRKLVGAGVADLLRRTLAEAEAADARARAAAERLDRAVSAAVVPVTVGEVLGRDDLPVLEVPTGWLLEASGRLLLRVEKSDGETADVFVSHRPIVTTGVLIDGDTGDRALVVEWPGERVGDGWGQAIVPAAETQDPRAFVALRNRGAPVAARNARELARWLDDLEAANAEQIPRAHHTTRLGWQGPEGRLGYLWGRRLLTATGERDCDAPPALWGRDHVRLSIPSDDGRAQLADGCSASGSLEGWLEVASLALPYPRVLLGVYASLASCLLGLVPAAPNAIVDWSGETSRGKTTTLALAASCWGRPELTGAGVMRTWDVSPAGLEQLAEMASHMPLILDDTKRATTRERDVSIVSALIYQIAAGQGRGRARPDGMRRTATWRTILLSTGEASATSFTQDAGARARVLAIRGSPLPDESGLVVAELAAGVRLHYGHAGPALVRWLLSRPTATAAIRARYARACEDWTTRVGGGAVGGRLAQILALLELGAQAAHEVLGLPRPRAEHEPIATVALPAVIAGAVEADRPTAALRAAYTWACAHPADFWGRHVTDRDGTPRQPSRGWAGSWDRDHWSEIAMVPECLARVLKHEGGYSMDDVVPRWAERGWLLADGRNACPKRGIEGEKVRCYIIRRSAIDGLDVPTVGT